MKREIQILRDMIRERRMEAQAADFMSSSDRTWDTHLYIFDKMITKAVRRAEWEKLVKQFIRVGYESKDFMELRAALLSDLDQNGYIKRPRGVGDKGIAYLETLLAKKLAYEWDSDKHCYVIRETDGDDGKVHYDYSDEWGVM